MVHMDLPAFCFLKLFQTIFPKSNNKNPWAELLKPNVNAASRQSLWEAAVKIILMKSAMPLLYVVAAAS